MRTGWVGAALLVAAAGQAAELTALETKWIHAGAPVLAQARQAGLPIDIIVQPQAGAQDVPLAMGFANGRCKLVLSMRGNPQAEATLAGAAPERQGLLIEAMTAHEVGHCWRVSQGAWHQLPAGFTETSTEQGPPELLAAARAQRETRREEGYADLVALAWTRQHHRSAYAEVYGWLSALRADQPVPRGPHDTRAFVRLAADPAVFTQDDPFLGARALWDQGLLNND